MNKEIEKLMMDGFKKEVEGVLRNGGLARASHLSMAEGTAILVDMGFKHLEDLDRNGWDSDYWDYFTKDDVKYTLSGSGYYGGIALERSYIEEDDNYEY